MYSHEETLPEAVPRLGEALPVGNGPFPTPQESEERGMLPRRPPRGPFSVCARFLKREGKAEDGEKGRKGRENARSAVLGICQGSVKVAVNFRAPLPSLPSFQRRRAGGPPLPLLSPGERRE